ncbi:MAG: putative secreted hydrolase [Alphaproteobacteria bacterium]|jgi:predicted secreted hydrolase
MVKLGWSKCLLIVCIAFIIGYIGFFNHEPIIDENNTTIFGRNVYNQTANIGDRAQLDYVISFPDDHAPHELFDIEWWYLTANLKDKHGNPFGLQWTLFRFRNPSSLTIDTTVIESQWHNNQLFMAHASVHSIEQHWFSERFARGGVGNAGVSQYPFSLFIDDWLWENTINSNDLLPATLNFTAQNKSNRQSLLEAKLVMTQTGPLVLHGENGYSIKSTGDHASHYYSAPFIDIEGELIIATLGKEKEKVSVSGQAWFDQEWTSQLLDANTLGWDWFSLHLDNGSKLMAFTMRLNDQDDFITGSYIASDGKQTTLQPADINLRPLDTTTVRNKPLPLNWELSVPSQNIEIIISSIKDDQWNDALIPYYEGMVEVKGSHQGKGFIELTGY